MVTLRIWYRSHRLLIFPLMKHKMRQRIPLLLIRCLRIATLSKSSKMTPVLLVKAASRKGVSSHRESLVSR